MKIKNKILWLLSLLFPKLRISAGMSLTTEDEPDQHSTMHIGYDSNSYCCSLEELFVLTATQTKYRLKDITHNQDRLMFKLDSTTIGESIEVGEKYFNEQFERVI